MQNRNTNARISAIQTGTISKLTPLKHIYCGGFMSRCCKMSQKTRAIAAVPKKTPQYATYSGGFCTHHKKIAVIVKISCSVCVCVFMLLILL